MSIATNLRRLMDERDLTPARLSERSGVSKASIDKYLKGHIKPAAEVLAKLSDGLGCAVEDIDRPTHTSLYKKGGNLNPAAVAKLLGVSTQDVRVGMQNGIYPFGSVEVSPGKTKRKYTIVPGLFWDYYEKHQEAKSQIEAHYVSAFA